MSDNLIVKTADFAMRFLEHYISEGDIVVDATLGNGNDTVKLAKMVGIAKGKGQVFGFDIQEEALRSTEETLKKNGLEYFYVKDKERSLENIIKKEDGGIYLYLDSHENILKYINMEIAGAIFNLGFLPGFDKTIVTKWETTLFAINGILKMLKVNGLIVIVFYPGHPEGKREMEEIAEFMETLPNNSFHCYFLDAINQSESAPCIGLITKKK
jgi:hypothetical protein